MVYCNLCVSKTYNERKQASLFIGACYIYLEGELKLPTNATH